MRRLQACIARAQDKSKCVKEARAQFEKKQEDSVDEEDVRAHMERAAGSEISRLAQQCKLENRKECILKLKEELKNRRGSDDDESEVERALEEGSGRESSRFLRECAKQARRSSNVQENLEKCRVKFGERMNRGRGKGR